MSAAMSAQEAEHADEEQSYEWVQSARAYGEWSDEYVEALVRNAHEKAVNRIMPISERRKVIQLLSEHGRIDAYNANAPPHFKLSI